MLTATRAPSIHSIILSGGGMNTLHRNVAAITDSDITFCVAVVTMSSVWPNGLWLYCDPEVGVEEKAVSEDS